MLNAAGAATMVWRLLRNKLSAISRCAEALRNTPGYGRSCCLDPDSSPPMQLAFYPITHMEKSPGNAAWGQWPTPGQGAACWSLVWISCGTSF